MAHQSLTKHEESCPEAVIECPNEGCVVLDRRGAMDEHREECEHEEVTCPSPGCDARVLRKKVSAHVRSRHLQKAEEQLQRLWLENARLKAASESELRHTAASPTSWVFNWRADGWGGGWFESEPHDFRGGVAGKCVLKLSSNPERSHFIGFMVEGGGQCRVHLTFSLLDTHDKTLRQVHQIGTARAPVDKLFKAFRYWGRTFTPTAEEKAQSVRSDGSVRLRAEVRLFPYGPA
ncbi:hypothetical protein T484DRAFT_1927026 [Baffinella frigidus]|nr:hypothetical protein T484DRAFT_1927026 [Cryptophyta sp. CCMP2293]